MTIEGHSLILSMDVPKPDISTDRKSGHFYLTLTLIYSEVRKQKKRKQGILLQLTTTKLDIFTHDFLYTLDSIRSRLSELQR